MTQHIGIVARSAEGAALCYRTICVEGAALLGPYAHPEVSLHGHSLTASVACLERGAGRASATRCWPRPRRWRAAAAIS